MSETLNSWNYRQNRISFNFACPFLSARGSWSNSRWLPGTNLLTGITREKVTVHKRKKIGTFTTDRLIQVRLLIPNLPISSREELYSPVWHILKNCYKVGRWRKKPKSSNFSGKFSSLPSDIVALRFLRIRPVMLPMKQRSCLHSQPGGIKRNLDPPFPPFHGSFSKMIKIYAILSRDFLLKHLRCRSFLDLVWSLNIRAYWLFRSGTRY